MSFSHDLLIEAPWHERLYEPVYRVKDAARYSGVHPTAVATWLRRGNPAWSDRARGLPLSYLELVEVAFATHFRRNGVPFALIRQARTDIARHFGSSHPFADANFRTDGYRILTDYPALGNGPHLAVGGVEIRTIVASRAWFSDAPELADDGSLDSRSIDLDAGVWFDLIEEKSSEFDYDFGLALTWHPRGRRSSVTIDPRMSFGDPAVSGIPTWTIKGRWEAGESLDALRYDYRLPGRVVEDALRFEGIDFDSVD